MKKLMSVLLSAVIAVSCMPVASAAFGALKLQSVEVEKVICIEKYDGYISGDWDESGEYITEWFEYSVYPENVTLYFKNGETFSGDIYEAEEMLGESFYYTSDQSYDNQWGIGEHTAILHIGLKGFEYTVEVVPTPVKSLEIEDIEIIENTCGYEKEDEGFFYYCFLFPDFTVTLNDGTVLNDKNNSVKIDGEYYDLDIDISSQDNESWTVGNTYEVEASILGVTSTFNVSIVKSPVKSLEIEDVEIMEGTCGYEKEAEGFFYYCFLYPDFTVTLNDGTVLNGENNSVEIDGEYYDLDIDTYSQYDEPWTAGNTYEVEATIEGFTSTFNVTIVKLPVKSLEIEDIEIIENTCGCEHYEGFYYYNNLNIDYTITLNDGTVLRGDDRYVEINGESYWLDIGTYSQYDEPWTVGNTYEVEASILGVTTTFNVSIVKSSVKSLEVNDIEVIEKTHGFMYGGEYYYKYLYPDFTVTLNDGTVLNGDVSWVDINGEYYDLDIDISSQYDEPWTVGNTYEVEASISDLGFTTTFNVSIVKSPVKSLEVEDVEIMEGTCGYLKDGVYYYSDNYFDCPSYTVTLNDGTVLNGDSNVLWIDDTSYFFDIDMSSQEDDPWTAGHTYKAKATVMGFTATFNVTILKTPVKSLEIEDVILYEGIDGEYHTTWVNEEEYRYYGYEVLYSDVAATATLEDGTVLKNCQKIEAYGEEYWLQVYTPEQYENNWVAGNTYVGTASLAGMEAEFNIKILENPVESVEVIKYPDKLQYVVGELYDLNGLELRVHYKDGYFEDISVGEEYYSKFSFYEADKYYLKHLDRYASLSPLNDDSGMLKKAGDSALGFEFCNCEFYITFSVTKNLAKSVKIKEDSNKNLILTVYNSDGTSYEAEVIKIFPSGMGDDGYTVNTVITDKGVFNLRMYTDENGFAVGFPSGTTKSGYVKSNYIEKCEMYDLTEFFGNNYGLYIQTYPGLLRDYKNYVLESFSGEITAENIDAVIANAGYMDDTWFNGSYPDYSGESVKKAVLKYFAVEDVDLTLSENYDPETDTYHFTYVGKGSTGCLHSIENLHFENGVWIVEMRLWRYEGSEKIEKIGRFKLNGNEQIISFNVKADSEILYGDVNGDGLLTPSDVVLLRRYFANYDSETETSTIEVHPGADVNGDGKLTPSDVVLLRRYFANYDSETETSTIVLGASA